MFSFAPKQPGETQAYTWRWNREMGAGETIASVAFAIVVLKGTESPVTFVTSGAAVITSPDAVGNHDVSQKFSGGINPVAYAVTCQATTSLGRILFDTCEIAALNPA